MEEKKDKEEIFNIKLNLYDELIDLQVNSDYNFFVKNICKILNISPEQLKSFSLSYNDEDGDSILLSTEDDYTIFYEQVKEKTVNSLIVEINENKNINPIDCFGSALNYQEQIERANNQIKNDNNNINNINNSNSASKINLNNNIFNSNDNVENKHDIINLDLDDYQDINNLIVNRESENNNEQINDLIFEYKCTLCSTYPIICVMYYCPECSLYLCEACHKNNENHIHPLLKIESKKELIKIKEEENEVLEKKKHMKKSKGFFNLFNNPNNQFNNNNPNNFNNNNINDNNQNQPLFMPFPLPNLDFIIKPFGELKKKKKIFIKNKNDKIISFFHQMNIMKLIRKARRIYNLEGISDNQIIEALNKANGNIDEAILQLLPK